MFQMNLVENIKTHIFYSITFFRYSSLWWSNVENYGTAR